MPKGRKKQNKVLPEPTEEEELQAASEEPSPASVDVPEAVQAYPDVSASHRDFLNQENPGSQHSNNLQKKMELKIKKQKI